MLLDSVITTCALTRQFVAHHPGRGHPTDVVTAVDALTLEIYRGEVFGFLGHNGAGKTTTVRVLNGVLAPTEGSARVLNLDPSSEGPALRRRTGVLTETPALGEKLTAREQLALYATLYDVPARAIPNRITTLLRDFELVERADEPVGGYSKGMRQRLALARALIHEPELIFLDEPTSGLDPVAARYVHRLIQQWCRADGRTVFLCTHNLNEAQQLCDRVAIMEQGKLVAIGTPQELAQNLWKGTRLEIEVAEAGLAVVLATLRAFADVRDVALSDTLGKGTSVISASLPDRESVPELLAAIVQAGGRVYRLTLQEPTLEDVYFALHQA
ncbi:MAG: ABC transporter ATP-binding protein [Anaerolineae bacterium]|nr:ABC transporter ATP-binding protein [Anaerolineae bacterium]